MIKNNPLSLAKQLHHFASIRRTKYLFIERANKQAIDQTELLYSVLYSDTS